MAVLSFTQGDKLAAVVVEKGWYQVMITSIGAGKANEKNNITYSVKLVIQGPKYQGKELELMLNTGVNQGSLLGGRQFMPDNFFLVLQAAVRKIKLDDVQLENFDTDELLNKPFDAMIIQENSEGILCNFVSQVVPEGAGQAVTF